MKPIVVDASVSLKWAIPDPDSEPHTLHALAVLKAVSTGECRMYQPSHWLVEMAGVLARRPTTAPVDFLADVVDLGFVTVDGLDIVADGIALSQSMQHHPFDTLYHAVALAAPGRTLVTADDRYYRKAASYGQIMRLADWQG